MTTVGRFAPIPKSRLSKQADGNQQRRWANEEEVEEQIEEENVEKTARENETSAPMPLMTNEEIAVDDDAVSAGEEMEEQVERKRVEKKGFDSRSSVASAEKWTRSGRAHE